MEGQRGWKCRKHKNLESFAKTWGKMAGSQARWKPTPRRSSFVPARRADRTCRPGGAGTEPRLTASTPFGGGWPIFHFSALQSAPALAPARGLSRLRIRVAYYGRLSPRKRRGFRGLKATKTQTRNPSCDKAPGSDGQNSHFPHGWGCDVTLIGKIGITFWS